VEFIEIKQLKKGVIQKVGKRCAVGMNMKSIGGASDHGRQANMCDTLYDTSRLKARIEKLKKIRVTPHTIKSSRQR